jgi:hypothetical protein
MTEAEFTTSAYWSGRPVAHKITETVPRGRVVVSGVIYSTQVTQGHGTASYECLLDDGTGEIGLLFLGRRGVAGIVVGTRCTIEGTARLEGGRLVVWNPLYRIEPAVG